MSQANKVHIATPDWVYDCVVHKEHLEPTVYHPRLLTDGTEPVEEQPMDAESEPGSPDALDDSKESPKGAKTKEALARMVSSRIMASWKPTEVETVAPAPPPPPPPPTVSMSAAMQGMFPTSGRGSRGMLRNITNSGLPLRGRGSRGPRSPRSPRTRGARGAPRVSES